MIGTPVMTIYLYFLSDHFNFNSIYVFTASKFKFYARETQSDSSAKSRVFELETFIFSFMYLFGKSQFLMMILFK